MISNWRVNADHVEMMGFDIVYPALSKISTAKAQDKIGEAGARSCWNLVTTSLLTLCECS